jgi:ketosteroid isomerase-like protein
VKRTQIEFMIGWLDALRRDDLNALKAMIAREVVWQGLREEWTCRGADAVVDTFVAEREQRAEIAAIELIGAEGHAILHARGGGLTAVEDIPLLDGIYNLFTIEGGKVTRIEDFADRGKAQIAAGLAAT